MIPYTEAVRRRVNRLKDLITDALLRLGVSANAVTVAGFLIACLAGASFALGRFRLGGVLILCTGACDVLDGAVAKRSGRVTAFGGFLDSCLDRLSDIALLGGAGLFYAAHGPLRNTLLAILAAGGAVLTSYARARAENIGVSSTVGFWERPERTFMLMMGGLFLRMPSVLWELAVFANITAAHRLVHVWRRVERPSWRPPSIPVVTDILFWEYPRYCWQYDVYVGLGILVPLLLPIQ